MYGRIACLCEPVSLFVLSSSQTKKGKKSLLIIDTLHQDSLGIGRLKVKAKPSNDYSEEVLILFLGKQ